MKQKNSLMTLFPILKIFNVPKRDALSPKVLKREALSPKVPKYVGTISERASLSRFASKMPNILSLAFLFFATLLLPSCSDDKIEEPANNGTNGSEVVDGSLDNIYLTFDFTMPSRSGSRSETNAGGGSSGDKNNTQGTQTEDGQDNENSLDKFKVYFYVKNGDDWEQQGKGFDPILNGSKVKVEVQLDYFKQLCGNVVRVLIGVNNSALDDDCSEDESFGMGDNMEAPPLGKFVEGGKKVPFSNLKDFTVDLTSLRSDNDAEFLQKINFILIKEDRTLSLSDGNSVDNTPKITGGGTLTLERSVARVDYRPKNWTYQGTNPDNQVYPIGEIPNFYAKMYSLQVFNVSKSSFVFRHTSEGNDKVGQKTDGNQSIFGVENSPAGSTNLDNTSFTWILDDDWDAKKAFTTASKTIGWAGPFTATNDQSQTGGTIPYFLNQPVKTNNSPIYEVQPVSNKNYGVQDVYNLESFKATYSSLALSDNYLPLFYLSENTPPSCEAMINGLSTGIAFKMVLCKSDGTPLQSGDLLSPENYATQRQALENAIYELESKENKEPDDINDYNAKKAALDELMKKPVGTLVSAGSSFDSKYYVLTIGSQQVYAEQIALPDNRTGYAITYYYYFTHNRKKDHELGTVEPMQYAVVRNNVYKICVTSLNGLPDPYIPNKHDEPQENVISVETMILSWARVDTTVDL